MKGKTRKQSRTIKQQKLALGVGAIVVVAILGYFSTIVVKDSAPLGNYVEGEHYTILDEPRRVRGNKIEVVEFFSYQCPHCYNFEPELVEWVDDLKDQIRFVRSPMVAGDNLRLLGRHYYTLEKLGLLDVHHLEFFSEIHDRKLNVSTPERLANWAAKHDIQNYSEILGSAEIRRKVDAADRRSRTMRVASVPAMIVHGKYAVNITETVGPTRMLDIVDHIVQLEIEQLQSEGSSGD